MRYQDIEFTEMELAGLKGALIGSSTGVLLGKILMNVMEVGFEGIRDSSAPIERLRYFQGLLDGLDKFQALSQRIAAIDPLEYKEEEDEDLEDSEEVVDVRY